MSLKKEFIKKNLNIPISLNNKLKQYQEETGLNFTASVITLLNQVLSNK